MRIAEGSAPPQNVIVICRFRKESIAMALPENLLSALSISRVTRLMHTLKPFTALLALALCAGTAQARAQSADRVPQSFDPTPAAMLANQHPMWASPANDRGALDANKVIDNLTLILTRSPEQQQAFDQFVADQQNPASPNYHHWLTPVEIGTRFGLSGHDIDSISGWLESQGLHVNWVAPSRIDIAFGGSVAGINRAFGISMHAYNVHGDRAYFPHVQSRDPNSTDAGVTGGARTFHRSGAAAEPLAG